jgi:hypothetical protein
MFREGSKYGRYLASRLSWQQWTGVAVLLTGLYMVTSTLHIYTYAWQTEDMAHYFRPALREDCPLRMNEVHGEPLLRSRSSAAGVSDVLPVNTGALKIGLLMLYNAAGGGGDWPEELMHRVIKNRIRYCNKHKYIPLVATAADIDPSRPAAWSKFLAIQKHLPNYDYIAYFDMDAVIMSVSTPLETFIEAAGPCSDLVLTEDWNGPNTGAFLVKNTAWSRWFMAHAWEVGEPLVPKRSPAGTKHPFEYEQRVVHYLLDSGVWKQRGLSKYHEPNASAQIRAHVSMLPQCAFNSYSLHPLDSRGLPDDVSRYTPESDFLVHFAGKKGQIKKNLIEHYLKVSEEKL